MDGGAEEAAEPAIGMNSSNLPPLDPAAAKAGRATAETAWQLNRLSLLLTLVAVLFFSGVTWALGSDGRLDRSDGLVLVALFLFWQSFQVFDVPSNQRLLFFLQDVQEGFSHLQFKLQVCSQIIAVDLDIHEVFSLLD